MRNSTLKPHRTRAVAAHCFNHLASIYAFEISINIMSGNKRRSLIYAVGAAAIVMAGAYSGANIKVDTEKKKVRVVFIEACSIQLIMIQLRQEFMAESNEQKIARLEAQRAMWTRQREELVKKINQLDAKKAVEEVAKAP
jgi:hypothetical protein